MYSINQNFVLFLQKNGPKNFFCFRRQGLVLGPLQDGQISLFPKLARKELFSFQVTSLTLVVNFSSLKAISWKTAPTIFFVFVAKGQLQVLYTMVKSVCSQKWRKKSYFRFKLQV